MRQHLIVAVAQDGTIGHEGSIPWHDPADLKHFKQLTMGHTLVMGRRTYESIGRPLPGRKTIVLSSTDIEHPEVITCRSIEEACEAARALGQDLFFCGGKRVYEECCWDVDLIHLSIVDRRPDGDTKISLDVIAPSERWVPWGPCETLSEMTRYYCLFRKGK